MRGQYKRRAWRPIEEARAFVAALGLKDTAAWVAYCVSGARPRDIPASPRTIYGDAYRGMAWWLGHAHVAPSSSGIPAAPAIKLPKYRPMLEAREYTAKLGLKRAAAWVIWAAKNAGNRPADIPSNPWKVYGKAFKGIRWWLGVKIKKFASKAEFQRTMRRDKITSGEEYMRKHKEGRYPRFPRNPAGVYGIRWSSITGRTASYDIVFPSVEEFIGAMKAARIVRPYDYRKARRQGQFASFPAYPEKTYCRPWDELLDVPPLKVFRSLEEFMEVVVETDGIKSHHQYLIQRRNHGKYQDFPAHPGQYYKVTLGQVFGNVASFAKRFPAPKAFMIEMKRANVTTYEQYQAARKEGRFREYPALPHITYRVPWNQLMGRAVEKFEFKPEHVA